MNLKGRADLKHADLEIAVLILVIVIVLTLQHQQQWHPKLHLCKHRGTQLCLS